MPRPIITVVGSFAVGMTLRTGRMPIFGETLLGSDFDMGPGGKGSNQAVAAARLGADTHFAGLIGRDKLGEIAVELYRREGVDMRYLRRLDDVATGAGFIILNERGENGIILDMGANQRMDEAFVQQLEPQFARSAVVMTVLELPVPAAVTAVKLGRKHGARTILNPAPAAALPDDVLSCVDYLTPNETELRLLLERPPDDPTPTLELAGQLRRRGVGNLIVTMGEAGALVLTGELAVTIPAVPVNVVDTTGAGDAFNAGLAIALAEGQDLLTAVRYATVTGALACQQLGVIPSLPTRETADAWYRECYG